MANVWKVTAFALATTTAVIYVSCAVFDVLFPPFGMVAALGRVTPWPIHGTPIGFVTGFALFTVAGLLLGAIYGIASEYWSKWLR